MTKSLGKNHLMEKMLIIFIAIQPILDLLTSFSMHYIKTSLTFGVIIRTIMFAITAAYIAFSAVKKKRKKILVYFVALFAVLLLNLLIGYQSKVTFNLVEEIKFITKTIYFILMLFSYYFVWDYIKNKKTDALLNKIVFGMTIVGLVMIVSVFTGTAIKSYNYGVGSKGWFSSGNEISAIMAICSPMVIIYSLKNTTNWKDIYNWLPTLLILISCLIVGTKVGMISSFFFIAVTIVLVLSQFFLKSNVNRRKLTVNLILSIFVLSTLTAFSLNTSALDNLKQNTQKLEAQEKAAAEETEAEEGQPTTETHTPVKTNKVIRLLLSSRDIFLVNKNNEFKEANFGQKLFGLGYSTTKENSHTKMIEMDFFDLFYAFGIIGFLLYMIPIVYFLLSFFRSLLKNGRTFFSFENILMFLGLIIGIGVSVLAGHVFSAPAVSIYVAIIMVYLYKNNSPKTQKDIAE